MLTDSEREELRRLYEAATPGEWTATERGTVWSGPLKENTRGCTSGGSKESHSLFGIDPDDYDWMDEDDAEIQVRADMDCIAAAHNALPQLLATAEAHATLLERLAGVAMRLREMRDMTSEPWRVKQFDEVLELTAALRGEKPQAATE